MIRFIVGLGLLLTGCSRPSETAKEPRVDNALTRYAASRAAALDKARATAQKANSLLQAQQDQLQRAGAQAGEESQP